jgi:hypothetical protein
VVANINAGKSSPPIGIWVLVLGGVGFIAGFFGPMALRPEANQGPMVGIFITGPGGALLGLFMGALFRFLPVTNTRRYQALAATAATLAVGTLLYCLPPPDTEGVLFEGTVLKCEMPEELKFAAIQYWEERFLAAPWGEVRAGWRREFDDLIRSNPGVVLTFDVQRQQRILRHRKPWNSGRLTLQSWPPTDPTVRYFADFAGGSCGSYGEELPTLYVRYEQRSHAWPPDVLPNLLGVSQVEEAPSRLLRLGGR